MCRSVLALEIKVNSIGFKEIRAFGAYPIVLPFVMAKTGSSPFFTLFTHSLQAKKLVGFVFEP
jgi:hypothetical protein